MFEHSLNAISPIDGRYFSKVSELSQYFSEYGLMKYRVRVELLYFLELNKLNLKHWVPLNDDEIIKIKNIASNFSINHAKRIKEIETVTNHDVKAVEYFIKEEFNNLGIEKNIEFIHFALTSQDINNTAIPLLCKEYLEQIHLPLINQLLNTIKEQSLSWKNIAMLAKTHGQPASPTTLGKEWFVFYNRLIKEIQNLKSFVFTAKFGGATGNFNAHHAAYPQINWINFSNQFIKGLGLQRNLVTTQIEPYDNLASFFDCNKRINTILIDFCKDVWQYISMEYFKQKINKNEVGSSAMPHKVNPIDFENAEGNLGIANALLTHFSEKLPISRLQRDLTDSTVLRNIGVPFAHSVISIKSIQKGMEKLLLNEEKLKDDLSQNFLVVAEGIQTILRTIGYPNPYEALKDFTRKHNKIGKVELDKFIDELQVDEELKNQLKNISPFNYTGMLPEELQ